MYEHQQVNMVRPRPFPFRPFPKCASFASTIPVTHMRAFEGKRVLITGGAGFIGSNLAHRLLAMGAEITIVDSLIPEYGGNPNNVKDILPRVHLNISDVRDVHSMKYLVQNQELLFNLAGQTSHLDSMHNPDTTWKSIAGPNFQSSNAVATTIRASR